MIKYNRLNILFLLCFMGSTFVSEAQQKDGFKKIFNGKNMKNWEADTSHWRIENGCFVGEVTKEKPLKTNTFMAPTATQDRTTKNVVVDFWPCGVNNPC